MAETLKVVVTGAAGQIAYSLLIALGNGEVFGREQPLELVLLEIEPALKPLCGIVMELQDCALPLVTKYVMTADANVAFKDADVGFLVGAFPRKPGMERKNLLLRNIAIFKEQGTAIDTHAKKTIKIVVVGNPANTNALMCAKFAPTIPKSNFSALTRLDHNRAISQVASKLDVSSRSVKNMIIWGNHSSTQVPDLSHSTIDIDGKVLSASQAIQDDDWIKNQFVPNVQKRGAAIIDARGLSSAMSAAKAICDHMRSWWFGTEEGSWVSMAVPSDGSYGIPEGVIYSYPVRIDSDRNYHIVQGLENDENIKKMMQDSYVELAEEKAAAEACIEK